MIPKPIALYVSSLDARCLPKRRGSMEFSQLIVKIISRIRYREMTPVRKLVILPHFNHISLDFSDHFPAFFCPTLATCSLLAASGADIAPAAQHCPPRS